MYIFVLLCGNWLSFRLLQHTFHLVPSSMYRIVWSKLYNVCTYDNSFSIQGNPKRGLFQQSSVLEMDIQCNSSLNDSVLATHESFSAWHGMGEWQKWRLPVSRKHSVFLCRSYCMLKGRVRDKCLELDYPSLHLGIDRSMVFVSHTDEFLLAYSSILSGHDRNDQYALWDSIFLVVYVDGSILYSSSRYCITISNAYNETQPDRPN